MLFVCEKCDCVDDTNLKVSDDPALVCTDCETWINKETGLIEKGGWHGFFDKKKYDPETDLVCNRGNYKPDL